MKPLKEPGWYLNKAYLVSRSIKTLNGDDQILAGFPKTGTTWVRYFLFSLLKQRTSDERNTIDDMNVAMPEFAHPSILRAWEFKECPRIIKTHWKCNRIFKGKRAVLIVRNPLDIVVSYFHYAKAARNIDYDGDVGHMLRDKSMGVEAFLKHFSSWESESRIIVRYEDLKNDPVRYFSLIAKCYGIEREAIEIQSAVQASEIKSMRVAQEKSEQLKKEFNSDYTFVRQGVRSQWTELLSKRDIQFYRALKRKHGFYYYD